MRDERGSNQVSIFAERWNHSWIKSEANSGRSRRILDALFLILWKRWPSRLIWKHFDEDGDSSRSRDSRCQASNWRVLETLLADRDWRAWREAFHKLHLSRNHSPNTPSIDRYIQKINWSLFDNSAKKAGRVSLKSPTQYIRAPVKNKQPSHELMLRVSSWEADDLRPRYYIYSVLYQFVEQTIFSSFSSLFS